MTPTSNEPATNQPIADGDYIIVTYDGGDATQHFLYLDDYAASLKGLEELLRILVTLVLESYPETAHRRVDDILRFEVRGERDGSYEVWLGLVLGVAGNAIWDLLKLTYRWTIPRFSKWFRDAMQSHLTAKRKTLDVDAILAAMEAVAAKYEVQLEPATVTPDEQLQIGANDSDLELEEQEQDEDDLHSSINRLSRRRGLIEKFDRAMKEYARPIGRSCETITITSSSEGELLQLTAADKSIIAALLILLPTEEVWRQKLIKFVRINRKTRKALMYFARDPAGEDNTHYAIIVDNDVKKASNVYTESFSKDAPIAVYARHAPAEHGRIRTMWELTVKQPEARLFSDL